MTNNEKIKGNEKNPSSSSSFKKSLLAILPFTREGIQARHAELMLGDLKGMKEELQSATQIQQLNALNRHDEALKSLSQDSDGQTYQDFHRLRHKQEMAGNWSYISSQERRRRLKRIQPCNNDIDERRTRMLAAHIEWKDRRTKQLAQICDIACQVRNVASARNKSKTPPNHHQQRSNTCEEELRFIAEGKTEKQCVNITTRLTVSEMVLAVSGVGHVMSSQSNKITHRRCSWKGSDSTGRLCICLNSCIVHPTRMEHDIISGAAMPFQLSTCAWHSTTCISEVHRSSTPPVTTPSLYSLCNECLAQSVKQPFGVIKLWDVPGVRLRVVSNNKSSNRSKNDESRDVRQLPVVGNNSLKEESQNKRNEKQLLDWNEIERGRPWFTPNRNAGLDVASIIPDAKGQAPRRHPPDGKRKAVTPPIVVGGIHTFLNRAKRKLKALPMRQNAAVTIQKWWRCYAAKSLVAILLLVNEKVIRERSSAAIILQALGRRFIVRCRVPILAKKQRHGAIEVQRLWRGYRGRRNRIV